MEITSDLSSASLLITEKLGLVPVNFDNADEYAEFHRQRTICGWAYSDGALQHFKQMQEIKLKSLFWIMIKQELQVNSINGKDNDEFRGSDANGELQKSALFTKRAGHISLDSYAELPDPELAREDRTIMTVSTFFILPEHRKGGLGKAAMDLIEVLATQEPYGSPQCHTLALTTLHKSYIEVDEPEWRGMWKQLGLEPPQFSAQVWYEKLGYVLWKEEPRYPEKTLDGDDLNLIASFMRKRLR